MPILSLSGVYLMFSIFNIIVVIANPCVGLMDGLCEIIRVLIENLCTTHSQTETFTQNAYEYKC